MPGRVLFKCCAHSWTWIGFCFHFLSLLPCPPPPPITPSPRSPTKGHLVMSGDLFVVVVIVTAGERGATDIWLIGMLLNILQYTGWSLSKKHDLASNVDNIRVERPWSRRTSGAKEKERWCIKERMSQYWVLVRLWYSLYDFSKSLTFSGPQGSHLRTYQPEKTGASSRSSVLFQFW